jgi:ATP-dependent DNA helicase PIF1
MSWQKSAIKRTADEAGFNATTKTDAEKIQAVLKVLREERKITLSEMQADVFEEVLLRVMAAVRTGRKEGPEQFLTGGAGSGKSYILRAIVCACEILGISTMVTAHQAVAALNVNGSTIYSAFKPNDWQWKPSEEVASLVIVDEISMVSAYMLESIIDRKLRLWTKQPSVPFGKCCMLFIGDLLQLPPVGDDAKPVFNSSLWLKNIRMINITENHRQNDEEFIDGLNKLRWGIPDSLAYFNENVLSDEEYMASWEDVPHLLATNRAVNRHNDLRLAALLRRTGTKDPYRTKTTLIKVPTKRPLKAYYTRKEAESVLPDGMVMCPGTVVMLTCNDLPGMRFCNGDIGVVQKLNFPPNTPGAPPMIEVLLNRTGRNVTVSPILIAIKDIVQPGDFNSIMGYPLTYGWATTIHKSQGISLDRVVINPSGIFAPAQLYVGLSRARSPSGMRLLAPIQRRHVMFDMDAVEEYRRLTEKNRLEGLGFMGDESDEEDMLDVLDEIEGGENSSEPFDMVCEETAKVVTVKPAPKKQVSDDDLFFNEAAAESVTTTIKPPPVQRGKQAPKSAAKTAPKSAATKKKQPVDAQNDLFFDEALDNSQVVSVAPKQGKKTTKRR